MMRAWWGWLPWVPQDPRVLEELTELRAEKERMRTAKQHAAERLCATQDRWAAVNARTAAVGSRLEQNHIGQLIEDAIWARPPWSTPQ